MHGIETFDSEPTVEATRARILAVGASLGREEQAARVVGALDADLELARKRIAGRKGVPPSVLFVFARGAGAQMVGCSGTVADALIRLAGARNGSSRPLSSGSGAVQTSACSCPRRASSARPCSCSRTCWRGP